MARVRFPVDALLGYLVNPNNTHVRLPLASDTRGFLLTNIGASIAQMVERKTLNLVVVGSIPTGGAFWIVPVVVRNWFFTLRPGAKIHSSRFSSVGRASD